MPKGIVLWVVAACGGILLVLGLNTLRHAAGWSTFDDTPDKRARRLSAEWRLQMPDGPGPHPAAILLSGCDGVRDNMAYWADVLARSGRATLIVDSHTPRGLDQLESWRLVCAGQALPGAERSGDVAVALATLADMAEISDDVVILGGSHGGWTAMEFVAHAASGEVPPGLTRWPAPPEDLLGQVSAVVLLYPYCGILNGATSGRWPPDLPALMILGEEDSIVSTPSCLGAAEELRERGAPITTRVLEGADHGFDQRERSPVSTLIFDEGLRDEAENQIEAFLKDVASRD
ncbi:hypothetical protein RDV64_12660 [Acuticoccus sp. MNP-M23]|uniref:dienelactone hydrolase family protein n=1 Tax=Acuticoccus sp. MNP-M23 TaxID=3072793 RepID=UPI002815C3E6|nr:hypothetical protein [Acuticoccus sp. MNP-M23]WMS40943.1 hypothetical protein RDV64_12660 [Acuticoccus sp. MNP-M23]